MVDEAEHNADGDAERMYSAPADALARARAVLDDPAAAPATRGVALWTLGRAAYYGNRMAEAVQLLREAVELVDDPDIGNDVMLTLAPALAKEGSAGEALDLLDRTGCTHRRSGAGSSTTNAGSF